jgi:hypothetical protein
MTQSKLFLLRYDTEGRENMHGFLDAVIAVRRKHAIPVTLFCTGAAIECREDEFHRFCQQVADDLLFDIQDHSYAHIGLGYSVDPAPRSCTRTMNAHSPSTSASLVGDRSG